MSETHAIHIMEALARRDIAFVQRNAAADATASGGILPGTIPLNAALGVMGALWAAFSNFHLEVTSVRTQDDEVRVEFMWGGIHDHTLNLPVPGLNAIEPTNKSAWVPDVFVYRFVDSKLAAVRVDSPVQGGIPGVLAQLGVVPT